MLNGIKFKEMLISGVHKLSNNSERINALNVFPVPDGDTGSNMFATANTANKEIAKMNTSNIGELSTKFARGMLLGARGNSGVILSQIFKGISIIFEGKEEVDSKILVESFKKATEQAYKSVLNPVEGTILTVIRVTSEKLADRIKSNISIENFFEIVVEESKAALKTTPNLLPVLKEVGVVDSGGEGLVMFFEGMLSALKGKPVKLEQQAAITSEVDPFAAFGDEEHYGEFGYCTEFLLELDKPKEFEKNKFEKKILDMGTSVVVVQDEDLLKVHLHIEKPGIAFNYAQEFGEFINIKSENMTLQANGSLKAPDAKAIKDSNNKVAIISANTGQGIIDDIKELGADFVIEGGQSMNPSAQDFIEAIDKLKQDEIIILPNNSNIILVAQQVAQTVDKTVVIIPTKTQMQGLTAMMYFNQDGDLKENEEEMLDGMNSVKTVQVTTAVRDTKIEGVKIKKNDFLSIADGKIINSTNSKVEAAFYAVEKLIEKDSELITIYFGEDATRTDAEELLSMVQSKFDVEAEVKDGQQPIYHFLVAIE